jgi:hypothetical protein
LAGEDVHRALVRAFLERAPSGLTPERLILVFEQGFAVVWRRAQQTLGDVTLAAVLDRVLRDGMKRYPLLSLVGIVPTGLSCDDLHEKARSGSEDEIEEALQFVLVEFLTVLGNLTADILTPSLHAELARLVPEVRGTGEDTKR